MERNQEEGEGDVGRTAANLLMQTCPSIALSEEFVRQDGAAVGKSYYSTLFVPYTRRRSNDFHCSISGLVPLSPILELGIKGTVVRIQRSCRCSGR